MQIRRSMLLKQWTCEEKALHYTDNCKVILPYLSLQWLSYLLIIYYREVGLWAEMWSLVQTRTYGEYECAHPRPTHSKLLRLTNLNFLVFIAFCPYLKFSLLSSVWYCPPCSETYSSVSKAILNTLKLAQKNWTFVGKFWVFVGKSLCAVIFLFLFLPNYILII